MDLKNGNSNLTTVSLEDQYKQLKEAEQRKDEFISLASHELKTPVTTLKVYLHIIEEHFKKSGDELHHQFAVKANNQIDKLTKLIFDLIDMSKLELGTIEYEDSTFNYFDLVEEVIEKNKARNPSHKIVLTGISSSKIKGDKERLSNSITNLLSNAAKFSSGENKIFIDIAESNNYITTTVKDFGIGISQENQNKVFEKFNRIHDNQQETYPGLGIGLFITSEIIKRHGGNILVKSEKGKETNFTFTLPVYSDK
jgi:signal transduction histidine kinase